MFNISEGFLRRSDPDTLKFLQYSFASNGELKSGYYAAEDRKYLTQDEAKELMEQRTEDLRTRDGPRAEN